MKKDLLGILYGVLFMVFSIGVLFPLTAQLLTPTPYELVGEPVASWEPNHTDVTASFIKKEGCHLVSFSVSGVSAGQPRTLEYIDLDGVPENYDRKPGSQTLNIRVLTQGLYYESISLHTRHLCGADYVNKVFDTLRNPNET